MFVMVAYGFVADSQSSNDRFLRLNHYFVNSRFLFLRATQQADNERIATPRHQLIVCLHDVQFDTIEDSTIARSRAYFSRRSLFDSLTIGARTRRS